MQHNAASAAAWLDVRYPSWAHKVNLDDFDIDCPCSCVGGQLDIGWLQLAAQYDRDHDHFHGREVFANYQEQWVYEIRCRQYDREPAHH